MSWWETPPVFSAGQVMSASGHLNSLARGIQMIFDRFNGYNMPFVGDYLYAGQSLSTRIRHKWDTLQWKFYLNGDAHIEYDGNVLAGTQKSSTAWTWYSGTEDISGLGLTQDEFYNVELKCTAGAVGMICVYGYLIRETTTTSYPTLVSFADATTPSAAEWQDLSDYLTDLHLDLDGMAVPVSAANPHRQGSHCWIGTFNRRSAYLYVKAFLQTPYWVDEDEGGKACFLDIYIDDVLQDTLEVVVPSGHPNYTEGCVTGTDSATINLDTVGVALGADYRVRLDERAYGDGDYHYADVQHIYEKPKAIPSMPGWITLPEWEHGDIVRSGSAPKVSVLKDDLELLHAALVPTNTAGHPDTETTAMYDPETLICQLHAVRTRRWLHFRSVADGNPTLTYTFGTEKVVSLPDASSDWMAYDLESIEGLFPGTYYELHDVTYALEDDNA